MSFQFTCPNCGTKMETPDEWEGREADCPECGQGLTLTRPLSFPSGKNMTSPPVPPPPPIPPPGAPDAAAGKAGNAGKGAANVLGCLFLLLPVIGTGLYIFAIVDFCGMFFGYDLTGYRFSPVVFGLLGQGCWALAGKVLS